MAMPDSIGTVSCCNCGRETFVRKNRGGFAYYRCEGCGVSVQHHIMRHSEGFVKNRVKPEKEAVPDVGKKPEITANKSPEQTSKPVVETPEKPAKRGGILAEFMSGG